MTAPIPDAPPPTWEQLEKGLVAVKTVVHGLVDFIQNHSKKGADPQQVSENVWVPGRSRSFDLRWPLTSHGHMVSLFSLLNTASTKRTCVVT